MPACLKALTALALAVPALGFAQSLQELYDAARGYDATYLAARALADSAQYRVGQAEALNRGSANVTAGATAAGDRRADHRHRRQQHRARRRSTAAARCSTAPTSTIIEQARKSYEAATADLEVAEQDLIVRVAQAYFDVLDAQDSLSAANADKKAIAEQLASAKRNFEVGTATITDTREAQARFDLRNARSSPPRTTCATKRLALDQLVGRSGVTPKGVSLPVPLPETVRADADQWVSEADAMHPLVRKARLGLDVATLETEKARAGDLPTVDLVASLGSSQGNGSAVAIGGLTTQQQRGRAAQLAASTPAA